MFPSQIWSVTWFGQNQRITRYFRLEGTSGDLQSNLLPKIGTALRPAWVGQGLSSLILKISKNTECLTSLGKLPGPHNAKGFSLFLVWTSHVSTHAHCCSSSHAPLWRWHILDVPTAPTGCCSLITSKAESSPDSQLPHWRTRAPTSWPSWWPLMNLLHFSNTFPVLRQPLLSFAEFP